MKHDVSFRVKACIAILLFAAIFIVILQVFLHNEMSPSSSSRQASTIEVAVDIPWQKPADFNVDLLKEEVSGLKHDIKELKHIKSSALNELQSLSKQYHAQTSEIKQLSGEKIAVSNDVQKLRKELMKIKRELNMLQSQFAVKKLQFNIPIGAPKNPVDVAKTTHLKSIKRNLTKSGCTFSTCFDHSQCPILSKFKVYVHKPLKLKHLSLDMEKMDMLHSEIVKIPFYVDDPKDACLFVVILVIDSTQHHSKVHQVLKYLKSLKTWKNDGQNHFLLLLSKNETTQLNCAYFDEISNTQASIVSSTFCNDFYRENFDVLLNPNGLELSREEPWTFLPSLVPIKRSYLFALDDRLSDSQLSNEDLVSLKGGYSDVYIHSKAQCNITSICNDQQQFKKILENSMFNLLYNIKDYPRLIKGIIDSFKCGAIPVLIGEAPPLPFSNVIDFKKAMLVIPSARITETHFILRTMNKIDVFSMKRKGRFVFETYLSSLSQQLKTIFAVFQHNIKLPPTTLPDYVAKPVYKSITVKRNSDVNNVVVKSAVFNQNWTLSNVDSYEHWNNYPGGHYLLPFKPMNEALPSSVQFSEDSSEYMPIGNGQGGDGHSFVQSLGGDKSIEHFTIIILTYNREMILLESLQRLAGLKYLNRVLVIWNNPAKPSDELDWPNIGVPIHVSALLL